MEFSENPEPGYNNYEIRRRGILCGEPAALESNNLTVPGTDFDDGIRNDKLHVASAAKREVEVEEEEEEDRGRKRRRTSSRICCGVCLDELSVGESVARLPCTDLFHERCIVAWLRLIQYGCPVCQMPVADHEDDELDDLSADGYGRDNRCPCSLFKDIELGCLK